MWGRSSEWKRHRFYKVSKRARAAYLILCLEEALKFYDKVNTEKWRWILKELWGIMPVIRVACHSPIPGYIAQPMNS